MMCSESVSLNKWSSSFDVVRFIKEVKERRALWDTSDEYYFDNEFKTSCWGQLVEIFMKGAIVVDLEDESMVLILQRKWKNIKDCYRREKRRRELIKLGKPTETTRKCGYMYYKYLTFLDNSEEDGIEEKKKIKLSKRKTILIPYQDSSSAKISAKIPPNGEIINLEIENAESTSSNNKNKIVGKSNDDEEAYSDRLFLLSLLKPMREVPEHLRFSVRLQLMQVIDNATKSEISFVTCD